MSYRIYLNIIEKNKFKQYYKNFKYDDNDNSYFHLHYICKNYIELDSNLIIKYFKKIKLKRNQAYSPYILNKKDLKEILKQYQNNIIDIQKEKLLLLEKTKDSLCENKSYDEIKYNVSKIILQYNLFYSNILWFFESVFKNKKNVIDSDYFVLQYFYLANLFEKFDNKNQVAIITHG